MMFFKCNECFWWQKIRYNNKMIILYTFRLLGYFQYVLAFNQNTLQKNMHQNFQQQPSIVTPVQTNESGGY